MSKFKPYQSPFEKLVILLPWLKFFRDLYYEFNSFDEPLTEQGRDPRELLTPYFFGGLNPLFSIKKDLADTFKPYKSNFYIVRDILQPIRGCGNVMKGAFNLAASLGLFLVDTSRYAYQAYSAGNFEVFSMNMVMNLVTTGGGLLEGITSLVRGLGQIVATPLTWFFRMPLRLRLTSMQDKPTFKDSFTPTAEALQNLVMLDNKTLEQAITIDKQMSRIPGKLFKAQRRNVEFGIELEEAPTKFGNCSKFAVRNQNLAQPRRVADLTIADSDWRVEDTADNRARTLEFLGLFTSKSKNQDASERERLISVSRFVIQK